MKKYELSDLVKRWEREDLTLEQAVGQLLLWLDDLVDRMNKVEIKQRTFEQRQSK